MNNIKITVRLAVLVGALTALLIVLGAVGLWSTAQSNEALHTVYEDRTIPTAQLASVNRQNLRNRVALSYAVMDPKPDNVAGVLKQMDGNLAIIDKDWKAYAATRLTVEEARLAKDFEESYARLLNEGVRPAMEALRQNNVDRVRELMLDKIRPLNTPVANALDALIKLQSEEAQKEYKAAEQRYESTRNLSVAAIVVVAILANLAGFTLGRAIATSMRQAIEAARAVAKGDLTHPINVRGKDEVAELLAELRKMQQGLSDVVAKVRQGSDSVSMASSEIAHGNQDLSSRTESQASALQQTAASMEELSSTVKQNADNARQANQLAQSASSVAAQGGEVVQQVVQTMQGISESSRKIADIINVIDGIAFQTNILALNAAVEAARAGEQGKGFAVVAGEVRNLASRSAEAAKEIKTLINDSVGRVELGTRQVDEAGSRMQEIVASIRRVNDIMGEISAASAEQSAGVSQVGDAVTQMDQATQQNAALVEEMAAAAASLRGQAHELVQTVAAFRIQGDGAGGAASSAQPARALQPAPRPAIQSTRPTPKSTARPQLAPASARPKPAPAPAAAQQAAPRGTDDGDWETF